MSILTKLARMWLTRSVKPFLFTNQWEQKLPFSHCQNLGLYIHIPFCKEICTFCPYCKVPYSKSLCERYIDALIREIHLVGNQYHGKKKITSLYFGGGTPALVAHEMKAILNAVNEHFLITEGIGIELHPDNVELSLLQTLKDAGVTKISIGVQSFQEKFQFLLGRKTVDIGKLKEMLLAVNFETVSMDFIFALPGQTLEDLKSDIDMAFEIGANHVAIYPFIDFTFTSSKVKSMPKNQKRALLDAITLYCEEKGYRRKSIWTFSLQEKANYSSMTRENFLGFGCSATTLLKDQFKVNTFSVKDYCKRVDAGKLPTSLTTYFSTRQRMVYYLFWTAYSMRIKADDFKEFFGVSLKSRYGMELALAKIFGLIVEERGEYHMTAKGAFYYHYYENFYTLAYIDKMWGIMRKEAFPEKIEL